MNKLNNKKWIEYPGYKFAWIIWETSSSYLISKLKNVFNTIENEWVKKNKFYYKQKTKL